MIYRPRTPVVEARRWTGDNGVEMRAWLGYAFVCFREDDVLVIQNRSGRVWAYLGETVAKEDGTFSVYEPELFTAAYEAVT